MFPFDLAELDQMRALETLPRRKKLWLLASKKCHWCGCETLLTNEQCRNQATIDHIVPRYKGGSNAEDNLVSACFQCNQRRNKEDQCGHPEGHLLGSFRSEARVVVKKKNSIPLTDQLLQQRDQAHKEIARLRRQLAEAGDAAEQLRTMTFRRLAAMKLKRWLEKDV